MQVELATTRMEKVVFLPETMNVRRAVCKTLEVFVEMKGFMKLFIISLRYKEYERMCEEPDEGNLER